MAVPTVVTFSSRSEFEAQLRACIARSALSLDMFDPDFALFPLGASDVDAALRHFLLGGGRLRLAMHSPAQIERHYPRLLRLIRDISHQIECRVTSRSLRQLTDSFCLGDAAHVVRRFHSDHLRGEAAFDAPPATDICRERFAGIWEESLPALHSTTTVL